MEQSNGPNILNSVSVKVPPFWPEDPALWFAQLEGQFALAGITTDSTKYNYVIANLDCRIIAEIRDVVKNPPATGKFDKVRDELISRLSSSNEQRVRQLISNEDIGDRKPSQFLRHLLNLAGPDVPDDFIKTLWSNRLPTHVQLIIASQSKSCLEDLAKLADTVIDIVQPQIHQISTPSTSSEMNELRRCVEGLTREIAELKMTTRSHTPSRGRYSDRRRSRSRSSNRRQRSGMCWYHSKFGPRANKCHAPCSYNEGNADGSR